MNEAMVRVLGYYKEELMRMHYPQILSKECLERSGKIREEFMVKGKLTLEETWMTKDGKEVQGEVSLVAIRDSKGKYVGCRTIIRDFTERKKTEAALKESEEKFRTFMESARDLIYMTDADGNIIYVNDSMARILGYSKEEMIGMDFTKIAIKKDRY